MSERGKTVFQGGIISDKAIQGKSSTIDVSGTSIIKLDSNYPSNTTFNIDLQSGDVIGFSFPPLSQDDIGKEFDFFVQGAPGLSTGAYIRFSTSVGSVLKGIATCLDSTLEIRDAVRIDIAEYRYLGGTLIKAKVMNNTQISFQASLSGDASILTITS